DLVYPAPPKGQAYRLGIYKLEGEGLMICWGKVPAGDGPATDRPKDFSTKPGSGRGMNIFKRSKPEQDATNPGEAKGPARPAQVEEKLIQVTYPVADLVTPKQGGKLPDEQLLRMVAQAGPAKSWSENGGRGTVRYFPLSCALVVKQSAE